MRRICLAGLCLSFLLLCTPRALAQDAGAPSIVVRVKSMHTLLQNLNLVVKLIGQEEAANQIEGLIKSKIGKNGINGIDPTRPLGAYARYGKEIDSLSGAVLLPIADEASVLALLDNLGLAYQKGKDGLYTHRTDKNVDVFFRFANKYLYITSVNAASIQLNNLPDPAKALAVPGDATLSFLARIDQMPQAAKKLALDHLAEAIETAKKEPLPNETKAQVAFRAAILDDMQKFAKSVLDDAADLRVELDVNDTTKELQFNMSITARPQTPLAQSMAALGNQKSPLTAALPKISAFRGAFHFTMPDAMRKAFESVIQEAAANSLAGIQDADKRKHAETLFNAIMPSAKSGDYQVVAAVLGPKAGRYSFLAAMKLKDGLKLGATVRDLIADAAKQVPAAEKGKIQLDFDAVGAARIHKFEAPNIPALDALFKDVAEDRSLYVAFRDDALFVGLGADSLIAMKSALAKTDAAPSPPLLFDMDVGRMAKFLARTDQTAKLTEGRIHVSIEGGASLNANVRMHLGVLELLMKVADEKGK